MTDAALRPFFSYFGGKWTLAPRYPPPEHDTIIEPFAGSAGYATRYPAKEVVLVERVPALAALWRWLIRVSVDEVMALPVDPAHVEGLEAEARALIGFWCARGRVRPATTLNSSWLKSGRWPSSFWGEYARARIAKQVTQIRHWRVIEGDYTDAPDIPATWFVDPPYAATGRAYLAQVQNYEALGRWCRSRKGLVIACERDGATWLPFQPFREAKSMQRGSYGEVVYIQRGHAGLHVRPITVKAAMRFNGVLHRHLPVVTGGLWATSVVDDAGVVRGVAIIGRPARLAEDGWTCEVLRCTTDETPNACSALYGAARRIAQQMGFRRVLTKTTEDEPGTSLLALGLEPLGRTRGGEHSRKSRPRKPAIDARPKTQWDLLRPVNTDNLARTAAHKGET